MILTNAIQDIVDYKLIIMNVLFSIQRRWWIRKSHHSHISGTFNVELYLKICEIKLRNE